MKKVYIEFVNVNDLTPAPFNPPIRTSDRALKDVIRSMEEDGFWTHRPLTITMENYIADGHRRWTAAKKLGISIVPCLRTKQSLEEAWTGSMESARPLRGKELIEAYSLGLRNMPRNNVGSKIRYYSSKYGEDLILFLVKNGMSISPIMYAENVVRYLGWDFSHVVQVTKWIVEHKLVRTIRYALQQDVSKDLLARKILNNEAIVIVVQSQ